MNTLKKLLKYPGIILLQIIMTQVVAFAASFAVPDNEMMQADRPGLYAVFVTLTFGLGIFLGGWIAIWRGWLADSAGPALRLVGALTGAGLPMLAGLFTPALLQAEGAWPSMLACLAGFYLVGIVKRK